MFGFDSAAIQRCYFFHSVPILCVQHGQYLKLQQPSTPSSVVCFPWVQSLLIPATFSVSYREFLIFSVITTISLRDLIILICFKACHFLSQNQQKLMHRRRNRICHIGSAKRLQIKSVTSSDRQQLSAYRPVCLEVFLYAKVKKSSRLSTICVILRPCFVAMP